MASSASKPDLGSYFTSSEAYLPLMLKARFALRTSEFKNWTEEEKKILTLLATVDVSKGLVNQIQKLGKDKVDAVILILVGESKPKPRKRPSLKIKILPGENVSSVVVMSPLVSISPQEQRKKAEQIAKEVMNRSASLVRLSQEPIVLKGSQAVLSSPGNVVEQSNKRNSLKNEKDFLILHANVKRALQNEAISDPISRALARQIIAIKSLIDQMMPFEKAIERCLNQAVLEQIIDDSLMQTIRAQRPSATRESCLNFFVEQFSEPASNSFRSVSAEQGPESEESEEKEGERKNRSRVISMVSAAAKPKLHPQSFPVAKVSFSADKAKNKKMSYPAELCNQELCSKMVQGVLVMKHLFKGVYKKIFSSKSKLKIAERFIQYHLMSKYMFKAPEFLFDACFAEIVVSNRKEFSEIIGLLLNPLTLKGMKAEPPAVKAEKLPDVFSEPPFTDRKKVGSFINYLAKYKYLFDATYANIFSQDEKMYSEFILEVSALMDALNCEFEVALKYMIHEFESMLKSAEDEQPLFNPQVVLSIYKKCSAYLVEVKKSESLSGALNQFIEDEVYFQHLNLFIFLMENVRGALIRCRTTRIRKVGELLIAVQNRINSEPISLLSALKSSLNMSSLRLIYQTEDEEEIVKQLGMDLSSFKPVIYLDDLCLSTEQEFRIMCEKASQYQEKKGLDPQMALTLQYLSEIHKLMEEEQWNWVWAKTRCLNHQALRCLFDSIDDAGNCRQIKNAFSLLKV